MGSSKLLLVFSAIFLLGILCRKSSSAEELAAGGEGGGEGCGNCGDECKLKCGTRQFRLCCTHFFRKRSGEEVRRRLAKYGAESTGTYYEPWFLQPSLSTRYTGSGSDNVGTGRLTGSSSEVDFSY